MKVRIVIVATVATVLLASCFSPVTGNGSTGSVAVTVPSLAEAGLSTSMAIGGEEPPDKRGREYYARVFIYQKGSQAAVGEVPVSGDRPETLTIKGVPEGDGYSLAVTIGRKANEALFPERYGTIGIDDRETFSITGGRITPLTVRVLETPFVYAFPGIPLRGLVRDNQDSSERAFVTATSKAIIALPLPYYEGREVFVTPAEFEVIGVDQGFDLDRGELAWASGPKNTIRSFDYDTGAVGPIEYLVPQDAIDPAQTMLSAVGYHNSKSGDIVAMFQTDGGLGGGVVNGEPTTWGDTGEQLRELVKGQPVYDVVAFPENRSGLFATRFGAFAADERAFNEIKPEELTEILLSGKDLEERGLIFIELIAKDSPREITTMEAYGERLFLGTAMGVFEARGEFPPLREGRFSADKGEARILPETAGMQVTDIALHVDLHGKNHAYLAVLGKSMLVIKNLSTGAALALPVVAGVPGLPDPDSPEGGVTGMTFLADYVDSGKSGGELYLGFAGDFGFAMIPVRKLLREEPVVEPS